MAVMFLYFGWITPAGVLLYWVTSSAIGVAQQQVQLGVLKRAEAEEQKAAEESKKAAKAARLAASGDTGAEGETKTPRRKKKK